MFRVSSPVRLLLAIGLFASLMACNEHCPPPPPPQTPATPMLVSGALRGSRACGNYPIHQRTLSFTCGPLPTTDTTGWQLKPLLNPANSQGTQWPNRAVVLIVTSATQTSLALTYVTELGNRWRMFGIPDGPGEPATVTGRHQYAWAASDNGTTKTWTLKFLLDTCTTDVDVRMAATNSAGTSSELTAILMRDPNELECISSGGGGGTWSATGAKPATSSPNNSCQLKFFGVCENCANGHPPSMNRWSGGQYCDEAEVWATYGYTDPLINPTPKAQLCTKRLEPNRENCEIP